LRKHIVECHVDEASNILCKHEIGSCFFNNSEHFRPERTVISLASSLPGLTERLARKSPCEQSGSAPLAAVELPDVSDDWDAGPMSVEDSGAVVVLLAEGNGSVPSPASGNCESSNATEQVKVCGLFIQIQVQLKLPIPSFSCSVPQRKHLRVRLRVIHLCLPALQAANMALLGWL
jgi:hypothetical protein